MEPLSPNDVKIRIGETPDVSVLSPDHRVFVDSPNFKGGNCSPTALARAAHEFLPISTGRPLVQSTVEVFENGQLKRYTLDQLITSENIWFLGPFSNPPEATNTGTPLTPGYMYLNTSTNQVMIWIGPGANQGWQPYGVPVPANFRRYFYQFIAATDTIPTEDDLGNNLFFNSAAPDTVEVYLNGSRLIQQDYTLNVNNTITLTGEVCANTVCEVIVNQIVVLDYTVVPFGINTDKWIFDGTTHTFPLNKFGGGLVVPGSSLNCLLSLNGRLLDPVHEYRTMGSNVIFDDPAPMPGDKAWMTVGIPLVPAFIPNAIIGASMEGTGDQTGTFLTGGPQIGEPVTGGPTEIPF